MEIERKFLLSSLPNLPIIEEATVFQGYLSTNPEIRIRRSLAAQKESCTLCIKSSGGLVREEVEIPLTLQDFIILKEMLQGDLIKKDYIKLDYNGYALEVSVVDRDSSNQFMYAEIEFDTIEHALAFTPPQGFTEVTEDPYYKMKNYWERTRTKG